MPIEPPRNENPAAYDSLFASYPALRLSLQPYLAGVLVPSTPTAGSVDPLMLENPSSVSGLQLLDLKPLRERAFLKSVDPNSSLCRYEFPGAGICRDPSCQDVHPNKLKEGVEPTGTSYPSPYPVGVLTSTLSTSPVSPLFPSVGYLPSTDHDTAEYICRATGGLDFDTILKALQEETVCNPTASLEDRVARVEAARHSERRPAT